MRRSPIKKLISFLVKIQNYIVIALLRTLFLRRTSAELVRIGSFYGGWWVPKKVLSNQAFSRTLISVGLGHDVSLDRALLENGFNVIGLDPLIECVEKASEELNHFQNFKVLHAGLWTHDGVEEFYAPRAEVSDAWSLSNIQGTSTQNKKIFPVISFKTLKKSLPSISNSDFTFLKMDIEGAELPLLKTLKSEIQEIDYLGVELDFLSLIPLISIKKRCTSISQAIKLLKALEKSGLTLIHTEKFNFFWTRA